MVDRTGAPQARGRVAVDQPDVADTQVRYGAERLADVVGLIVQGAGLTVSQPLT